MLSDCARASVSSAPSGSLDSSRGRVRHHESPMDPQGFGSAVKYMFSRVGGCSKDQWRWRNLGVDAPRG